MARSDQQLVSSFHLGFLRRRDLRDSQRRERAPREGRRSGRGGGSAGVGVRRQA